MESEDLAPRVLRALRLFSRALCLSILPPRPPARRILRLARFQQPSLLIPPCARPSPPSRLPSVVRPSPKASPEGRERAASGPASDRASSLARKREPLLPTPRATSPRRAPPPAIPSCR